MNVLASSVTERTVEGEVYRAAISNHPYNGEDSAPPPPLTGFAVADSPGDSQGETPRKRGWWRR